MQPDKKPAAAPAAHTPARWAAGGISAAPRISPAQRRGRSRRICQSRTRRRKPSSGRRSPRRTPLSPESRRERTRPTPQGARKTNPSRRCKCGSLSEWRKISPNYRKARRKMKFRNRDSERTASRRQFSPWVRRRCPPRRASGGGGWSPRRRRSRKPPARPIPEAANNGSAPLPTPPAPTTAAADSASLLCPSSPNPASAVWRAYFSKEPISPPQRFA